MFVFGNRVIVEVDKTGASYREHRIERRLSIMEQKTCPYCGTFLNKQGKHYSCSFCVMALLPEEVQIDHQRLPVRRLTTILDVHLSKTTPELMKLSTFELLGLLKLARKERREMYELLKTFRKINAIDNGAGMKEEELFSGSCYQVITRKIFVLENLLRERLGYAPRQITTKALQNYLEHIEEDKTGPMIIRTGRRAKQEST